jgi:hypothetical protein
MALVTIENKKAICPSCTMLRITIKVLNPFKSELVRCLTILTYYKDLVLRYIIAILSLKVVFSSHDYKRLDCLALRVDSLDYCHPLPIA